jgi:MFS family permease
VSSSYRALALRSPRPLAFGVLHTIAATVGQTFVISLFLPHIKTSFGFDDADAASLFTLTTVLSAGVLWVAGRGLDRADVVRYSALSATVLVGGCAIVATAHAAWLFALGLFGMRLGGNALLTHVALTATARYFTHDRGKALSIAGLGSAIGEPCVGVAVVYLIASWNWRGVLCAVALLALMLILIAHALIRANARFREPHKSAPVVLDDVAHEMSKPRAAVNARYWVKSALLFVLSPLIVTALIFHQSVVAQAKGLPLEWFAVTFSAFALTRAVASLMIGPVIDRIGSTWLFAVHLLPFSLAVALLAAFPGAWVVPVYWLFTGATGGLAATLQVAVIAEHVAPQRLGSLRGLAASLTILASATGPALYGTLLARGFSVSELLWGSAAAMLAATGLGAHAARKITRGARLRRV